MKNLLLVSALCAILLSGCQISNKKVNDHSYNLGVVAGFSELINAGVKTLALSAPLPPDEMDKFIEDAKEVAAKHSVKIYRENDLLVTDMFPADIASGLDVLLLYQGNTLDDYLDLKNTKKSLEESERFDQKSNIDLSRRFGRLLSYSPREINRLLSENTTFRTLDDFGVDATNLFLYYNDIDRALEFYSGILGFENVAAYDNAYILRISNDSYLILVDAEKGMHSTDEPKTVALALLTQQLDEWYTYLVEKGVKIKYEYKPKEGSAHDGFVLADPEGYLLEFERFNQHPENEAFIPVLKQNKENEVAVKITGSTDNKLAIHSTITWLYYNDLLDMQNFYQDVMGFEEVADQGWTKIFHASETGFIAIVDGLRGMHSATENKSVNVGFIVNDLDSWYEYANQTIPFELRGNELGTGPESKYRAFVGYCPGGYYLEFDKFYPHSDNTKLLEYLNN